MYNQKGFSLIELMVAVFIAGSLTAIAAPIYKNYDYKAKQAEAKVNLSSIYEAQAIFKLQHNTYYANLVATGFEPEGTFLYNHGFGGSSGTLTPQGYNNSTYGPTANMNTTVICGDNYSSGHSANCAFTGDTAKLASATYIATRSTFLAGSRRFIEDLGGGNNGNGYGVGTGTGIGQGIGNGQGGQNDGDSRNDAWTINHRKELVHIESAI